MKENVHPPARLPMNDPPTDISLRGVVNRERAAMRNNSNTEEPPFGRHPYFEPLQHVLFGLMDVKCLHCATLHWLAEA